MSQGERSERLQDLYAAAEALRAIAERTGQRWTLALDSRGQLYLKPLDHPEWADDTPPGAP